MFVAHKVVRVNLSKTSCKDQAEFSLAHVSAQTGSKKGVSLHQSDVCSALEAICKHPFRVPKRSFCSLLNMIEPSLDPALNGSPDAMQPQGIGSEPSQAVPNLICCQERLDVWAAVQLHDEEEAGACGRRV